MATATKTKTLGPKDHGRVMTLEEFDACLDREGYRSELIDGRVYVSPLPNLPHEWVLEWIGQALRSYSSACPAIINRVSQQARVFVPNRPGVTCPQPDFAAYHDFPLHTPYKKLNWQQVSPILVVEIVSPDDPEKDRKRNVELYRQVPSIQEYWVLDSLGPTLTLTAYRRHGRRWKKPLFVVQDAAYSTPLLPGFTLTVNAQP
jgi:Uma2 family endonuclease